MLRTLSVIALCLLLGACVSTRSVMLGGVGTYPEVRPNEVHLFLNEGDVPGDFVKIALITASGGDLADEIDLMKALRKRAAKLGANGVVLLDVSEPSSWERIAGAVLDTPTGPTTARGVAIRLAPAPQPQP